MSVKIKLFAQLAEVVGPEVAVDLPAQIDKQAVLSALTAQYPQAEALFARSNVAVNQTYIFDETVKLDQIAEIAVIPPVSGG